MESKLEDLSITLAFESTPAFGAAMASCDQVERPHAMFHADFVPPWRADEAQLHKKTNLGLAIAPKRKTAGDDLAATGGHAARGRVLAHQLLQLVRSDALHPLFVLKEGGASWSEVDTTMLARFPHAARIGDGAPDRVAGLRRLYRRWKPPVAVGTTARHQHKRHGGHQHMSKLALAQAAAAGKLHKKQAPWDKARIMHYCDHGDTVDYCCMYYMLTP